MASGGPGGAGGVCVKYLSGLTPGNTFILTIGAAGAGGNSSSGVPASGGNGGDSILASGTQTITTLTATHGTGGTPNNGNFGFTTGVSGLSGTGINGDINILGSNGISATAGSRPGSPGLGYSPAQESRVEGDHKSATGYGGGGGGGVSFLTGTVVSGGNGSPGICIIEWYA